MKLKLMALGIALLLGSFSVYAQNAKPSPEEAKKNKELEKKWKDKKKAMKPLELKEMMDQRAELIGENEGMKRQLTNMGKVVADKDAEMEALRREVDSLRKTAATPIRTEANEVHGGGVSAEFAKGVWFRVQVGVYSKLDMSQFKDNNKNFTVEQDSDGTYKYTLGHFRDYWEADNFKKYIRKMGVKDAWIVAYKDNERMNIKDVLEAKDVKQ